MDTAQPVIFLWRNSPTVVIGRHQNPWKECKVTDMEKAGVTLARRRSGGGAVYQDFGNSIFTFLSSKTDYSTERNFGLLQKAIDSLGVKTSFSGRNDVLIDGRKISGSAFKHTNDRSFHHGTILVDINKDDVERYLTVNKLKLQSKGVDSVRQRITNLTDFVPTVNHDLLCTALIREFCAAHGQDPLSTPVEDLVEHELMKIDELRSIHDELSSWEWRFGHTPEFQYNMETRFPWGIIDLYITADKGVITSSKLYSDTLYPVFVDAVQRNLVGVPHNADGINLALNKAKVELAGTPAEPHIDELRPWLLSQL